MGWASRSDIERRYNRRLATCFAVDELQRQKLLAIHFIESVDSGDLGMTERREDLCFTLESREALGIERESVGKNLERDIAIQPGIAAAIHLAHATRADGQR
jgi:hypothetical protein